MIKTDRLKDIIKLSGYKYEYLASQLNISRHSLRNKVEGVTEFKANEIKQLSYILELGPYQLNDIFFT